MPYRPLTVATLVVAVTIAAPLAHGQSNDMRPTERPDVPLPANATPDAERSAQPLYPNETQELRALIRQYADEYEVPRPLVQRVIVRESTHRPTATNGPYMGLMQIHPNTARAMGYEGPARGLLDPETNLKYAVRYLRGAWILARGSYDRAVHWYSRGYHAEASRRGMLEETGLR